MRLLILSEQVERRHGYPDSRFAPDNDVVLDVGNLGDQKAFEFSVFDYDVAIIHTTLPRYSTSAYYRNMPKLFSDTK